MTTDDNIRPLRRIKTSTSIGEDTQSEIERGGEQSQSLRESVQGGAVVPDTPPPPYTTRQGDEGAKSDSKEGAREYPLQYYINYLNRQIKTPTSDEVQSERKKERRNRTLAGLADGLTALSNLYFTTKGAPSTYEAKNSYTQAVNDRYDRLKKEQEENKRYWTALQYQAQKDKLSWQDAQDALKYKKEYDDRVQTRYEKEQERKNLLAQASKDRWEAQARKDDASVAFYQAKIEALEEGKTTEEALKQAKIAYYKAKTSEANRRGTSSWVSSSGGKGGATKRYAIYGADGKPTGEYTYTAEEAAVRTAENGGEYPEKVTESETTDSKGKTTRRNKRRTRYTTASTTTQSGNGESGQPEGPKLQHVSKLNL